MRLPHVVEYITEYIIWMIYHKIIKFNQLKQIIISNIFRNILNDLQSWGQCFSHFNCTNIWPNFALISPNHQVFLRKNYKCISYYTYRIWWCHRFWDLCINQKQKKNLESDFFFFWKWKNVCFNSFLEEITLTRNLACLLHHLCWWTTICVARFGTICRI